MNTYMKLIHKVVFRLNRFFHRQHSEKFVYFLSMQVKMYCALKKKPYKLLFLKSAVIMICCFVYSHLYYYYASSIVLSFFFLFHFAFFKLLIMYRFFVSFSSYKY
jgi:hypothetical protein